MNNKNKKLIFFISLALLCIIIVSLVLVQINNAQNKSEVASEIVFNNEDELKSIISKFGGRFIKIEKSSEQNFLNDIYLSFPVDLFKNGKSQEFTYTNIIDAIVKNKNVNIRLIDSDRNIIIRVYYNISSKTFNYTVNGEDDYFTKYASILSLNEYEEIKPIEVNINSELLKKVINNNWQVQNSEIGTRESFYNDYEIFFEEGINIKRISGKIYNIVFNSKYNDEIINEIKVGDSFDKIEDKLGKSELKQGNIIGYKTENFYIFFSENEISIYRFEKYDYSEFEILLEKYINSEIGVKEFTNQLTYLWNDYVDYSYDSNYVSLNYYMQGVSMYLTLNNPKNIIVYGNYENIEGITNLIADKKISAQLDKNGMLIAEFERLTSDNVPLENLALSEYIGKSSRFKEIVKNNKVEFKALNENDISCSLVETINSYLWFSDTIFVYSVQNKGIYYFDLETRESTQVIDGKNDYTFNSFEDGILNYDDDEKIILGSD